MRFFLLLLTAAVLAFAGCCTPRYCGDSCGEKYCHPWINDPPCEEPCPPTPRRCGCASCVKPAPACHGCGFDACGCGGHAAGPVWDEGHYETGGPVWVETAGPHPEKRSYFERRREYQLRTGQPAT